MVRHLHKLGVLVLFLFVSGLNFLTVTDENGR